MMVISEKCCRIYFRKRGQWSQKLKERKRCLWRNPCPWETDSQEHYVLTGFSWAESSALGQTGGASAGRRGGRLSELCIRAAPATASGSSSCERCGEEGGRWEKAADGYGQTGAVPGPHQESSFHASAVLRGCCLVFLDNSKKRLLSRLKTSFFVFKKQRETSFFLKTAQISAWGFTSLRSMPVAAFFVTESPAVFRFSEYSRQHYAGGVCIFPGGDVSYKNRRAD